MKNFTNNFKQFTSRLSARWLIMALMLLLGTSGAWAATITSDGTARLYYNMSAINWWIIESGKQNFAYFFNKTTGKNAWSSSSSVYSGNTYYVTIPKGDWEYVILTRDKNTTADWEIYNQTVDITLVSTSNYLTTFKDNTNNNSYSSNFWGTAVKPTSTGKVTASSTTVNVGDNVTLTPSLTSNQTINDIKSTTYTISPSTGASVSGSTFTATAAGTYTVTAKITYNPDGYTSLTSTVSPTVTITVIDPCSPATSITSATLNQDGTISLVGNFTTCGTQYHGFQWRIKGQEWCAENSTNSNSGYVTKQTDVDGEDTDTFTPTLGNTYEFRTYIYGSPWVYGSTIIEVATCTPPSAPSLTNPDAQCGGSITLPETANSVNLKWYTSEKGSGEVNNRTITSSGTFYAAAVTECESTSRTAYTVTINPIPEVNLLLSTLNICIGSIDETDLTTLSHVEVANGSAVWYNAQTGGNVVTEADLENGRTYWVAAENSTTGCKSTTRTSFTININNLPERPSLGKDEYETCAHASNTVNLDELAGTNNVVWYIGETEVDDPGQISLATAGTFIYTAKAMNQEGCQSATGAEFELTVNPLPTINIGENVTAVLYEDVQLTATGENIANVVWTADKGTITKDETDPKKAVLTYDQTDDVTVTAKAISAAGCESAEVSKKVTFGEEDCSDDVEYDNEHVEIWLSSTLNKTMYLHRWYENGENDTNITTWPGASTTKSGGYYKWVTTSSGKIGYIFHDNTATNKSSDASRTMQKGYRYYFTFNGGTGSATFNKSERITTTTPKPITTPAVKMVSAYSEEGSGELRMTAQIVKTGCNGNMTYYFKYRLKGAQEWSHTAAQTATGLVQGSEINATVTGLNQGGTYEIQAVINNNNEAVSNILEYVVNIQETAISDVTLQLANADGDVLQNQNQIYCVGSTAYIKLSYRGTAHKSLEWIAENELQPVNGKDKLFSYVVRGNETITANVANDANEGTPATGTIDIKVYTIATTPDISIDRTEVCSADQVGAKITVNAPQIGITYQAYKMVGDVETPHGDAVVADNAESIIINSIKETGTYYVKAWNAQCPDAIAVSLSKFAVTKIDASSNTIAISPETASTNPWMPVTVKVDKNSAYDYTLVCKQRETDVTDQMVINKKGDSYVIKFPKPESAVIDEGQVVFDDITYSVTVSLNGNVECGVTSATSTVTLTNLIEDCD